MTAARKLIVQQIGIEDIIVPDGRRPVNEAAVASLSASIKSIGLQTPISLRRADKIDAETGEAEETWVLVTGRHRLEAFRQLGRKYIDAVFMDGDEIDAELWEIAENLHRADLTREQRDDQIRRFAALLIAKDGSAKPGQVSTFPDVGGRGNKGIASRVAEQTGVSAKTVKRVLTPKTPKIVKIADEPLSEEEACERWVAQGMAWWNRGSAEWRDQFLARVERPVMDRRFG